MAGLFQNQGYLTPVDDPRQLRPITPEDVPYSGPPQPVVDNTGMTLFDPTPAMKAYSPMPSEHAANFLADYIGQDYADRLTVPLEYTVDPIYEGGRELAKSYQAGTLFEDAPQTMLEAGFIPIPGIGPAAKAAKGIRAYHGSPHDFDRFSMDKIGTGEGAQAYGHGLYFAENEGVAQSYRDALSGGGVDAQSIARGYIDAYGSQKNAAGFLEESLKNSPKAAPMYKDALALLKSSDEVPPVKPPGSMYEVNIKADPDEFLDWDAKLSEQPKPVLEKLDNAGLLPKELKGEPVIKEVDGKFQIFVDGFPVSVPYGRRVDAEKRVAAGVRTEEATYSPFTGQTLYEEAGAGDSKSAAAERLKAAGVQGIKYLDQGSRGKGEGSRNFVTFRDDIIEIVRKYGIAGAAAMTGLSQAEIAEASGQGIFTNQGQ